MVTLFAASLSTTLYSNIDVTMLGFFTNDSVVGLYSTAIKFIHLMSGILIAGVSVLLPRVSLLMAEKNDEIVQRNQMIVSNCIYMITIPCICGMIVWGRWILAIFAGSDFQGAYVILCILSMTLFSTVTRSLYESMMLVPMRKDKIIMAATFSSALLNIILNYILIPRFSGIGAAVASVASEMTVISIYSLYSCVKKTYKVINHETLHYIIGGVLILTFWILLCMVLNESVSALIATLLGGGLYIAYCYIYKELYFRQFLTFFKFGKGNRK
jgi:O-antigen/teichoic acid export membrane protein